jgi:glycosyltransferase involved in cell wall biosynthesis
MRKILYLITQSETGGAQKYCYDLAVNLKSDFKIIFAFGEQGEKGELAKNLNEAKLKFFAIPHLKRKISIHNDWLAFLEIIDIIKKIEPDIIHLNSSKISILGSLAGAWIKLTRKNFKKNGLKIIYTAHGWVFNEPLPAWKKYFYLYAEKITAPLKDKIICVSEYDRQIALKEKIAPKEKLILIHNGIEPVKILSRLEARKRLKINNDDFIIGSIGNLYTNKGFEFLIEAVKILKKSKINIKAVIIGSGRTKKYLKKIIAENKIENDIIFTGRIKKAYELLSAFDIYACSSLKEGLSYTIIEAMFAGLPIIATEICGNPELIEDNKSGLLVEARKSKLLALKIKELYENSELRNLLGERAKKKAEEEFNFTRMLKETKNIYFK